MEADLVINSFIVIPGAELSVSVSRASGPGGQHVNKTSSRVSLRWNILHTMALSEADKQLAMACLKSRIVGEGDILIHAASEKSQFRNRQIARERLARMIRDALLKSNPRIATKPTAGSKAKRVTSKKRRSVLKKLRKLID
jgi:ribosome-associated protein